MYISRNHLTSALTIGLLGLVGCSQFVFSVGLDAVREAQPRGHEYYFDKFNVQVVESPTIETAFPSRAAPNPAQDKTDLSYWVNEVLPYPEDRHEDGYIVYPKHGIIAPILTPNKHDKQLIQQGKMFNHYPYLNSGALHYFGKNPAQGVGNMVIAAHSSYKKSSVGNYKTIFQALPISQPDDKVFIYLKNDQGSFDFYEYSITESYETPATNVSVLKQNVDIPTLTTYGCYVIGSNKDRRINRAILSNRVANHSDLGSHQMIAKNDSSPTHTSAPVATSQQPQEVFATQSVSPTDETETAKKQTIAAKLAKRSASLTPSKQKPVSNKPKQLSTKYQSVDTPVYADRQQATSPTPVKTTSTYSRDIPLAFKIQYLPSVKEIANKLFLTTLRKGVSMDDVLTMIEQLEEKYHDSDKKLDILAMLKAELTN